MGKTEGLLIVYTGDGKGKTTAALGLALRTIGHDGRVFMMQFMKGQAPTGERVAAGFLPALEIVAGGRDGLVNLSEPAAEDRRLAAAALKKAEEALSSGRYRLVVLDEANVAVACGLLHEDELLAAIAGRADGVNVVITGRYATPGLVGAADLVSEVREVKHPFQQGVPARAGIEF